MQQAIIVDLDGTLADNGHRVKFVDGSQPKDWDQFNAQSAFDPHNEWCREIVWAFNQIGYRIIFLTARSGSPETREITKTWLNTHIGPGVNFELIMRKDGDFRPDYVVKQELYNLEIAPYFHVLFAIDDKKAVVDMWRDIGLPSLHCAEY